ncbi:uncharacterized protein LOC131857014 [Cryptomeria japonica]|uniref:uncharacterized protein LOC131857014 n=1 Tax=Cryptomeria japonica TaxID=3369 RepID=UPI0027DA09A6|nr:uncharacterized protein LOC131857014 [Cryptomeria japonica]
MQCHISAQSLYGFVDSSDTSATTQMPPLHPYYMENIVNTPPRCHTHATTPLNSINNPPHPSSSSTHTSIHFNSQFLYCSSFEGSNRSTELASLNPILEKQNEETIQQLYDALGSGDAETVQSILAPDLEWWFHGPAGCEYLMRLLTGLSDHTCLPFLPQTITGVGDKVFVEGRVNESLYWVHVWSVENGIATQLREYFNTSLTVTEFRPPPSSSPSTSSSSHRRSCVCNLLWQSELSDSDGESLPGLVLAV